MSVRVLFLFLPLSLSFSFALARYIQQDFFLLILCFILTVCVLPNVLTVVWTNFFRVYLTIFYHFSSYEFVIENKNVSAFFRLPSLLNETRKKNWTCAEHEKYKNSPSYSYTQK